MTNITYHYCVIKQMPTGAIAYADRALTVARALYATEVSLVRDKIAEENGWEERSFNIISLTRL